MLLLGPQQLQSGVWKVAKAGGPLWQEGNNVQFRDLGIRQVPGAVQKSDATGSLVREIVQAFVAPGERRAYLGTDINLQLYSLVGGVWTRTVLGTWPTAGQYADLETWGTWLVATNNADPVKVWKNTGAVVNLAGTPFTRAALLKRKQVFLLAFNTNNLGPTAVEWASDSNIEDWTPTSANKAGNVVIRDLESDIICVADLGPRLAIYSKSSMVLGSYVGSPNQWGFQRAIRGIGAVSPRSVVTLDPFNYGLTRNGIFKTDGSSFAWVTDPAMLKYLKDTADFSKETLFWGYADAELNSVSFYFLTVDNLWRSIHFYPDSGVFTLGDLGLTAGGALEVFDHPLVASNSFQFGSWGEGVQHFGSTVPWTLKTNPIDFGTRDFYKTHNLTLVEGQWDTTTNLIVRAHESPEDPGVIAYSGPLGRETYFSRDAKLLSWEFYGTGGFYTTRIEIFGIPAGVAQ